MHTYAYVYGGVYMQIVYVCATVCGGQRTISAFFLRYHQPCFLTVSFCLEITHFFLKYFLWTLNMLTQTDNLHSLEFCLNKTNRLDYSVNMLKQMHTII